MALARSRPIPLARAILECFRTFSERGGFMSLDFGARQFAAASTPDGRVLFQLIDGPLPFTGPIANLSEHPETKGIGLSGFPPRSVPLCTDDSHCPPSSHSHCCCDRETRRAMRSPEESCVRAPEALGLCEPAEHSRPGAPRHCVPLSHLTHAYDVATRPWLLPMAANHSPLVAQLLPLLGAGPLPSARMSISGALAWLDARGMTRS